MFLFDIIQTGFIPDRSDFSGSWKAINLYMESYNFIYFTNKPRKWGKTKSGSSEKLSPFL